MKKSLLPLLAVSLAANAALLVVAVKHSRATAKSDPSSATATHTPATATSTRSGADEPLTDEQLRGLVLAGDVISSTVDNATLVSRLRAAGYSPDIVRAILTARVTKEFGVRRKAAVAHQEAVPFWKPSRDTFPNDPKAGAAISNLAREQTKLLKQLLGPDAQPDDEWSQLLQERHFGYLPGDKASKLQDIVADYADMRNQVYGEARGLVLPEDQAKLSLIEKEQRADLASLLTPEELENYDLRTSNEANALRYQLAGFNPTEDEFRAIYRLQKDVQDKFIPIQGRAASPEAVQQWQVAQQQLPSQIQAALTPDRAAAYRQTTAPVYQQATQILSNLNLPLDLAPQIVDLQADISQRSADVQRDSSLSPAERAAQLAALQAEAQGKLTTTLGDRGYKIYLNQGGYWLMNLTQRQPQIQVNSVGK